MFIVNKLFPTEKSFTSGKGDIYKNRYCLGAGWINVNLRKPIIEKKSRSWFDIDLRKVNGGWISSTYVTSS